MFFVNGGDGLDQFGGGSGERGAVVAGAEEFLAFSDLDAGFGEHGVGAHPVVGGADVVGVEGLNALFEEGLGVAIGGDGFVAGDGIVGFFGELVNLLLERDGAGVGAGFFGAEFFLEFEEFFALDGSVAGCARRLDGCLLSL